MNELVKWRKLNIRRKKIWRQLRKLTKQADEIEKEVMELDLTEIGLLLSEEKEQPKICPRAF